MHLVMTRANRRSFLTAAEGAYLESRLAQDLVFQCPMDPDVRSNIEGVCPRCGMKLRAGIPEPIEFPMDLKLTPSAVKVGEKVQLEFSVLDPENSKLIQHFQIVHDKLFHMFVISQDLQFFVHDHPVFGSDGKFSYEITFPKPGLYRLLGDFYPDGATPQLIAKTIIVPDIHHLASNSFGIPNGVQMTYIHDPKRSYTSPSDHDARFV